QREGERRAAPSVAEASVRRERHEAFGYKGGPSAPLAFLCLPLLPFVLWPLLLFPRHGNAFAHFYKAGAEHAEDGEGDDAGDEAGHEHEIACVQDEKADTLV